MKLELSTIRSLSTNLNYLFVLGCIKCTKIHIAVLSGIVCKKLDVTEKSNRFLLRCLTRWNSLFFSKKLHSAVNKETIPVNNRSWGEELGAVLRALLELGEGKATLDTRVSVKH